VLAQEKPREEIELLGSEARRIDRLVHDLVERRRAPATSNRARSRRAMLALRSFMFEVYRAAHWRSASGART
jgi:hypothetical protein